MKKIVMAVVLAMVAAVFSAQVAGTQTGEQTRFKRAPTSTFKINCLPGQTGYFDPIIHPGERRSSHHHQPFGGKFHPDTDYRYLRNHGTSCNDEEHKSAYWNPVAHRKSTGNIIPATDIQAYYRVVAGTPTADLQPPPRGVELIAGDGHSTSAQYGIVDWGCGSPAGRNAQEGVPGGRKSGFLHPVDCDPKSANPLVKAVVHFPNCFTGARESANFRAHAAYPVGYPENPGAWRCPKGYPIRSPKLDYSVRFRTSNADGLVLSSGAPETMHADWIHAANQAKFQEQMNRNFR